MEKESIKHSSYNFLNLGISSSTLCAHITFFPYLPEQHTQSKVPYLVMTDWRLGVAYLVSSGWPEDVVNPFKMRKLILLDLMLIVCISYKCGRVTVDVKIVGGAGCRWWSWLDITQIREEKSPPRSMVEPDITRFRYSSVGEAISDKAR